MIPIHYYVSRKLESLLPVPLTTIRCPPFSARLFPLFVVFVLYTLLFSHFARSAR